MLRWVFSYRRSVLQTRLGQGALYDIRNRIYNTMQSLSFAYHDRTHSGTLISNVVEDVNHLSRFLEFGIFPMIESPVYIAVAVGVLYWVCWPAALASTLLLALGLGVSVLYFRYGKPLFAETKRVYTESVQLFTENVEGHLVVRAYGKAGQQKEEYDRKAQRLHDAIFKETVATSVMSQSMIYAAVLGIGIVMAIAIVLMRRYGWELTAGQLFMIFFLQSSLTPRVRMLTRSFDLMMRTRITADRLAPLFSSREYLEDAGREKLPAPGPGALSMQNVHFAYGDRHHALRGISLDITAGETIGLVGRTGSGKSTLALLLCRFYDPQEGRILLDGRNIRSFPVRTVREQFSLVFQETFLFSASVRENIAYGKPDATNREIEQAAKTARIHDFVMSMPKGYDTPMGEKGVTLSGGQRQRLSVARAVLRRPRFLVLDDCTSALDTRTEQAIIDSLNALQETSTMIIIAHRLSSVARADTVFVLERGRIIERGSPRQLDRPGTVFSQILQTDHCQEKHDEHIVRTAE
jgi:ATP-binding cassette subfamily B protein